MRNTVLGLLLGTVLTLSAFWFIGMTFLSNNLTIERVDKAHNTTIIRDGEVVESNDWIEILGYNVSINLQDSTYIGR